MLGSTFFDGFSRTSIWQNRYYNVQVDLLDRPALADLVGQLMNLGGLLLAVAFIGGAFRAATKGTEVIAERSGLAQDFIDSLIPIALVYVIAHYFSLLLYQGEVGFRLLSDPWGRGWDLFGTHELPAELHVPDPAHDLVRPGRRARHGPHRRARRRARPGGRPVPHAADGALDAVPDARADGALHGRRPMGPVAGLILAHGGIPGLIAETSLVFVGLGLFGFFIRRSAKKEREREKESNH